MLTSTTLGMASMRAGGLAALAARSPVSPAWDLPRWGRKCQPPMPQRRRTVPWRRGQLADRPRRGEKFALPELPAASSGTTSPRSRRPDPPASPCLTVPTLPNALGYSSPWKVMASRHERLPRPGHPEDVVLPARVPRRHQAGACLLPGAGSADCGIAPDRRRRPWPRVSARRQGTR